MYYTKMNLDTVTKLVNITWCALHIRSMSCLCKNLATTSAPNVKETPRSFSPQPSTSLSGSAHSRSHNKPWSGTSVGRITLRICSIDWRSGERPERGKIFEKYINTCQPLLLGSNGLGFVKSRINKAHLHDSRRFSHLQWQPQVNNWSSLWRSSTI